MKLEYPKSIQPFPYLHLSASREELGFTHSNRLTLDLPKGRVLLTIRTNANGVCDSPFIEQGLEALEAHLGHPHFHFQQRLYSGVFNALVGLEWAPDHLVPVTTGPFSLALIRLESLMGLLRLSPPSGSVQLVQTIDARTGLIEYQAGIANSGPPMIDVLPHTSVWWRYLWPSVTEWQFRSSAKILRFTASLNALHNDILRKGPSGPWNTTLRALRVAEGHTTEGGHEE